MPAWRRNKLNDAVVIRRFDYSCRQTAAAAGIGMRIEPGQHVVEEIGLIIDLDADGPITHEQPADSVREAGNSSRDGAYQSQAKAAGKNRIVQMRGEESPDQ